MSRKIRVADLFCGAGGTSTGLRQACDMLFRHTWHRHMGLMYALGQGAYCPSAGVMRSLQREGLITWTGPFRRPFGRPEMERPEQDRGWQITDAGRALLSLWAYCGEACMPDRPCKQHEYAMIYNDGAHCIHCGAQRGKEA